jgi:hypothetical protein
MKIAIEGAWAGTTATIAQPIKVSTLIARIGLTACSTGANAIAAAATPIAGMTSLTGDVGCSAISNSTGPDSAENSGHAFCTSRQIQFASPV